MQLSLIIPYNVTLLAAIAGGVIIFLAVFVKLFTKGGQHKEKEYPYLKRDALFTAAERSFLSVLNEVVHGCCLVLGKVRLADVIRPADELARPDYIKALNQIAQKRLDFVLCDPATTAVLGVIELDDASPDNPLAKRRDALVDAALWAAGIHVLHLNAQTSYLPTEVTRMITEILKIELR
jgi:hypothetical protein